MSVVIADEYLQAARLSAAERLQEVVSNTSSIIGSPAQRVMNVDESSDFNHTNQLVTTT